MAAERVNYFKGNGKELVEESQTQKKIKKIRITVVKRNKVQIEQSQTRHPSSPKLIKVHFLTVCWCHSGRPADVSGHAWGPFSLPTRQALLSAETASVCYCQSVCACARVCSHLAPGTVFAQWPDAQFSFTPSPNRWTQGRTYGQFNTDIIPQYHHVSCCFVVGIITCSCLEVLGVKLGLI